MPFFTVSARRFDLNRRAVILDTNVLYGAFNLSDGRHLDCEAYLELEEQYLVPISVVVETWGLLVGRNRDWDAGLRFLKWLNDPATGALVVDYTEGPGRIETLARSARIDCVDAAIIYLADEITRQCRYAPAVRVATYDTADFLRILQNHSFRLTLVNLMSLEELEMG